MRGRRASRRYARTTPFVPGRLRGYQVIGYTHGTKWLARRVDATALVVEYEQAS